MRDFFVVARKEVKELLSVRDSRRSLIIQMLVLVGWMGVFMPLQDPEVWVVTPAMSVFLPLLVTGGVVADSFAGERERKTLETLLATRLPDHAIFLGKVAGVVCYSWGMTVLVMGIGLVAANLARGADFPSPGELAGRLIAAALVAGLVAGVGVLISLRARTVREAQQTLSLVFVLLPFLLVFAVPAIIRRMPAAMKQQAADMLASADPMVLGLAAMVALGVVDAALLAFGIRRFQRARLIL
ncbi:MAG: ABC transporter permease subunit [Firmicutes bacterium]|nr:ABC transporter permease subunit [Bacillota bacterium]